jgi:hypothetical protein
MDSSAIWDLAYHNRVSTLNEEESGEENGVQVRLVNVSSVGRFSKLSYDHRSTISSSEEYAFLALWLGAKPLGCIYLRPSSIFPVLLFLRT